VIRGGTIPALRAEGDDLIRAVDRYGEGNQTTGVVEFEPLRVSGRPRRNDQAGRKPAAAAVVPAPALPAPASPRCPRSVPTRGLSE